MSEIIRDLTKVPGATTAADLPTAAQGFEFHPSTLAAQISACVGASYSNGQICVNFPIVGNICFAVALPIPSGTSVKVCMETCGFKIQPPFFNGIKATVYVQDTALWSGVIWGSC